MGNTVSNNKKSDNSSIKNVSNNIIEASEIDTLNWNNYNTDEISVNNNDFISNHNIPTELSYLDNMKIPTVSATESETQFEFKKPVNTTIDINLVDKLSNITESASDNSPFISSEMYKFVMQGGANHDESESSSTSSSSSDKKKKSSEKEEVSHNEDHSDDHSAEHSEDHSHDSEMSGGSSVTSASYVSSSEHQGVHTTSSVSSENRVVSSSLNTSDINLISLKN